LAAGDRYIAFPAASAAIEARWRSEIARLRIPSLGRPEAELLATLVAVNGARRALELGTAIGYSAAYLATAMGPAGRVDAVELNPERAALARRLWAEAGLGERITLHEGNALELATALGDGYDLVFIDLLWEIREGDLGRRVARDVTAALRHGGVLVADNCGQPIPAAEGLKEVIASGPYRTTALLPLGDGVFVAVKG
jgi:predicted O-methyltransferase YrrM